MTKTLFSITEVDRLLRKERADFTEYNALSKEVAELKAALAIKEDRLKELSQPRWQESAAMIYVRNCVMDRIDALFGEADGMVSDDTENSGS